MDFLVLQNRVNAGLASSEEALNAAGKRVVVIGGGDTGADCVGTARRQGARSVHQVELLPMPALTRTEDDPWPTWPRILRTSSSHEEGCDRTWSVLTKEFLGDERGRLRGLRCVKIEWESDSTGFRELPGSEFVLPAELAVLATGFVHAEHGPALDALGLALDARGNVALADDLMTSVRGVFAAGDCVSGPTLVVRAIGAALRAGEAADRLMRASD
jgi:NADPH-dependent glutamate synthase beta subunit-like oxidoreductase